MKVLIILFICLSVQPVYGFDEEGLREALLNSDDALKHKDGFYQSAKTLIRKNLCTVADFIEIGGWVRAPGKIYKGSNFYFTWCGLTGQFGRHSERYYFNPWDQRIYQCSGSICETVP